MWSRSWMSQELFGPRASRRDRAATLVAATLGAAVATYLLLLAEPATDRLRLFVIAAVAFDLFGGLWSNSQSHAWAGVRRSWRWKVAFVGLHPHAFIMAWATTAFSPVDALLVWAFTTGAAALVAGLPNLRRLSCAIFLSALGIGLFAQEATSIALAWFVAAYLLKLVVAFAARSDAAA